MIFRCTKCNLVWRHELDKCIYCGNQLEKSSPKLEVVHSVKVNIASCEHPQVPYYVIECRDKNGNLYYRKSDKDMKKGDKID